MSRRDAVCEMDLIRGRGFLGESGSLFPPFSISSSNFSSDRPFSAKPRSPYIDFSRVKELNDAIQLFHKMKSMQRKPTIPMYNNLLSVTVTIEQYPLALDVFDEMPRMSVPVDVYLMSIAVNCCYRLKDVNCGFALVCLFFKRGCEANVVTVSTLVKGPFSEDKVAEAVKLLKKVVVMVMEQLREEGEKLGNGEVKKENFADLMKGEGGYGDQNVGVEKASVVGLKVAEEAKARESLRKLHDIVAASDGIMIARGDLGVGIPLEQIPTVQEEIIYICRQLNKPVMVASQLLESMVEYPTPTRPEVADVSEAFRQYADALMLSGESAIGPFGQKARSVLRMTSSRMELWSREENRQNVVLLHNLTASLPDQIAEQICNSAAAMAA